MSTVTTTRPLSNREVAERLDVHFTTVSRLRRGERDPSTDLIRRICDEFAVDRRDLIEAMVDKRLAGFLTTVFVTDDV